MELNVRRTIITCWTEGQVSSALSTVGFSGFGFVPRNAPSAVITNLQSESCIQSASDCAEKPANTTEWMAPIRAHASTAIANSGIIGMYKQTRSPFFT